MLWGHWLLLFIIFELLFWIWIFKFYDYEYDDFKENICFGLYIYLIVFTILKIIFSLISSIFSSSREPFYQIIVDIFDYIYKLFSELGDYFHDAGVVISNLSEYSDYFLEAVLGVFLRLLIICIMFYIPIMLLLTITPVVRIILFMHLAIFNIKNTCENIYAEVRWRIRRSRFNKSKLKVDRNFEKILGLSYQQLESCIKNRPDCGLKLDETEVVMRALLICQACKCSPNIETLEYYQEMARENSLTTQLLPSTKYCRPEQVFSDAQLKSYLELHAKLHTMKLC